MRGQLALFLVVAVLGTLSDQIHVRFEVLSYSAPVLFGQAAWVPLVFGLAAVLTVNGYGLLFRRFGPPEPRPTRLALLLAVLEFTAAYFATGIFKEHPVGVAVGLTLAWIAVVARRPSIDAIAYGLATAVAGPLAEALLSSTGTFAYLHPDVAKVPVWLPALYLHAAVLGRVVHRRYFDGDTEASVASTLPQPTAAR